MYLLDPQVGGRRRALARDKAAHALKQGGVAARKTSRHLGNRTRDLIAETGSTLRAEVHKQAENISALQDDGRTRSRFGRGSTVAALGAIGLGLLAQGLSKRSGRAQLGSLP
jgi:hypothetical protein